MVSLTFYFNTWFRIFLCSIIIFFSIRKMTFCTVYTVQYTVHFYNTLTTFIYLLLYSSSVWILLQYCTVYCINAYFISFKILKDIFVINNLKWYQIQHQMIFIESRSDLRQLKHGFFCFVTCIHFSRVCRYIKDDKS